MQDESTRTRTRPIEIFVNGTKVTFDTDEATGAQIKAKAGVPPDYSLYLTRQGQ